MILQNLTTQPIPVPYKTGGGIDEVLILPGSETAEVIGTIGSPARKLIEKGYIRIVITQSSLPSPAFPSLAGYGLLYIGSWVGPALYGPGNLVDHDGSLWLALKQIQSTVPPEVGVNWKLFSLTSSASFLGLDPDDVDTDHLIIRDGSGWTSGLIGDSNVSSLSTGKITGLNTALSARLGKSGGTMTGQLSLVGDPTSANHAARKAWVETGFVAKTGSTMTGPLNLNNPTLASHATNKGYVDGQISGLLPLTGGTMLGHVLLVGSPSNSLHPASKGYSDATYLARSGGTLTGNVSLTVTPTDAAHVVNRTYADTKVAATGGTMSGFLLLHANPTDNAHAARKVWVDSTFLALGGGTMTGFINLHANPTATTHAARKAYVDTMVPLAGGTMTGLLTLSGAPSSSSHAATKGYVDSTVGGLGGPFLSLAGGIMSGAITGTHGLLQKSGGTGQAMTGQLVLAELADASGANGLYFSTDQEEIAFMAKRILRRGATVYTSDNYDMVAGDGFIISNAVACTSISLLDAGASGQVVVKKASQTGIPVVIKAPGSIGQSADLVLAVSGETITFEYIGGSWIIIDRFTPQFDDSLAVVFNAPGTESGDAISVTGVVKNRLFKQISFSAVTNEGGGILGFTVTSGAEEPWAVGDIFEIHQNSTGYNGYYTVTSKVAGSIRASGTYTSTGTGILRGNVRPDATEPEVVLFSLSNSATDPFSDPPSGLTISCTVGSAQAIGNNMLSVRTSVQNFTVKIDDSIGGAKTCYLHALSAGNPNGSVFGLNETNVTNVVKFSTAITAVADAGGGDIDITVTNWLDWQAGDEIVISGTANYDGTYTVDVVDSGTNTITIAEPFVSTQTGTMTSNEVVSLTVTSNAGFSGKLVLLDGPSAAGGSSPAVFPVAGTLSSNVIGVRTTFDSGGAVSGGATQLPSVTVTFA